MGVPKGASNFNFFFNMVITNLIGIDKKGKHHCLLSEKGCETIKVEFKNIVRAGGECEHNKKILKLASLHIVSTRSALNKSAKFK